MKSGFQFFLLVGLLWGSLSWADSKNMDFLKRMNHAAGNLNYDGVFLHINGNSVDTLRVIHKADNNTILERLYALNGNPREVIRDAEKVLCFMPERKMGHAGLRSGKKTGFPGFMVNNLEALSNKLQQAVESAGKAASSMPEQGQVELPADLGKVPEFETAIS